MTRGKMNKKEFDKYLNRDKGCPHCGSTGENLIPQHRSNRGMGGGKSKDRPSNIIVMCSLANGLMESSASFATLARAYGWKLSAGEKPEETPVYLIGGWFTLDNNFRKEKASKPNLDRGTDEDTAAL